VRRTLGYVSLILGFTLLFLAPFFRWYALPRVDKAPTDVYDKIVSVGSGRYFDAKSFSVTNTRPLQNISIAKGNPAGSTHDVAVVSVFQRTVDVQSGTDIDYALDTYAFNRDTGYAVHCCGDKPRHEGLTLKFPFGTKRTTYPFYDFTGHRAFPARYVRDEDVAGLKTYLFESHVPDTTTGTIDNFPGFLAGQPDEEAVTVMKHYTADTTLWVEPVTGAIIKAGQRATQWVTRAEGTFVSILANTDLVNDGDSIQDTAGQISSQLFLLVLIRTAVPFYAPIAGAVLVVVALILLRRPARSEPEREFADQAA
jgi:hypothetical protein